MYYQSIRPDLFRPKSRLPVMAEPHCICLFFVHYFLICFCIIVSHLLFLCFVLSLRFFHCFSLSPPPFCLLVIPLLMRTWQWLRTAVHCSCDSAQHRKSIWSLPAWTSLFRRSTYQHSFIVVSLTTPGVEAEGETSQRPSKQKSHVLR
jgi:hypothetical protein